MTSGGRRLEARRAFRAAPPLLVALIAAAGCRAAPGRISGTVDGEAVESIASAYLLGHGDDPAHTSVVYLFDAPVACDDLATPGWGERIPAHTGSLEIKLGGNRPGAYAIAALPNPARGEASASFKWSALSAPEDDGARSGHVQIDALDDRRRAVGSFEIAFASGALDGTFSARWCPAGQEP